MVITGVIRPPPDIRVVADRTASYVAKNGRAFESRILKSEKGKTPKFAFLQPTSPFHAYYEDRIKFYEIGDEDGGEEKTATQNESEKVLPEATSKNDPVRKKEKKQKASAIDPVARALLSQRARITKAKAKQNEETEKLAADDSATEPTSMASLPPPSPLELVTIVAPSALSAAQIETIQLVAHFAALDGKGGSFLHQLTVREWNNSEFSFCQPRHAHFAYFSALVDAYRKILGAWTLSPSSNTPEGLNSIQQALDEVSYRAEYEREIEQQKLQQEEGEVLAIDWHDFVVVETIDFPVDEVVELSMLPPPPPPPTTADTQMLASQSNNVAQDYEEEEDETIRVVPSYTPKVVGAARPQAARAIDPITGKSVSVADVPEHLRIQLLDPKWAEERKKFQEKQKDSNLVGDDAIVTNISRFARGDKKSVSTRPSLVGLVECLYLN
jgi:splicing factor 3A subunit 1